MFKDEKGNSGLLTAGAGCCLAASVLWPFALPSRLLYAAGAGVLFAACMRASGQRPEFAAARKHLAAFGVLMGLCAFLQGAEISRLLALGGAAFSYFAMTLLCAGCEALREKRPANERQTQLPPVVGHFELCAGGFALCQIAAFSLPGLRSLADLLAMACYTIGFALLLRYFTGFSTKQDKE